MTTAGVLWCWGANDFRQLGTGSALGVELRPAAAAITGVQALALGTDHGCVLLADGTVACWGKNDRGQAGNGIGGPVAQPALIR